MTGGWRDEWAQNARLRLAVVVAVAVATLSGLLAAMDALDARVEERDRLAEQVQRLRAASTDSRWTQLRDDVSVLDTQWRSRAWREPTEGRMQAAVQDWLREQCRASGLTPRELEASVLAQPVSAASAAMAVGEVRTVRARLAVEMAPMVLHELLARLDAAPGLTRVTRLAVRNGDRRVVEIELEALFVAGERASEEPKS